MASPFVASPMFQQNSGQTASNRFGLATSPTAGLNGYHFPSAANPPASSKIPNFLTAPSAGSPAGIGAFHLRPNSRATIATGHIGLSSSSPNFLQMPGRQSTVGVPQSRLGGDSESASDHPGTRLASPTASGTTAAIDTSSLFKMEEQGTAPASTANRNRIGLYTTPRRAGPPGSSPPSPQRPQLQRPICDDYALDNGIGAGMYQRGFGASPAAPPPPLPVSADTAEADCWVVVSGFTDDFRSHVIPTLRRAHIGQIVKNDFSLTSNRIYVRFANAQQAQVAVETFASAEVTPGGFTVRPMDDSKFIQRELATHSGFDYRGTTSPAFSQQGVRLRRALSSESNGGVAASPLAAGGSGTASSSGTAPVTMTATIQQPTPGSGSNLIDLLVNFLAFWFGLSDKLDDLASPTTAQTRCQGQPLYQQKTSFFVSLHRSLSPSFAVQLFFIASFSSFIFLLLSG